MGLRSILQGGEGCRVSRLESVVPFAEPDGRPERGEEQLAPSELTNVAKSRAVAMRHAVMDAKWSLPNGSRLSCGALKEDSFLNLRAPPASSAC